MIPAIALAAALASVPETLSCTVPNFTATCMAGDSVGPITGPMLLKVYASAWDCEGLPARMWVRDVTTGVTPGHRVTFTVPVSKTGPHLWGVEVLPGMKVGETTLYAECFSNVARVDYRPGHTKAERDSALKAALAADKPSLWTRMLRAMGVWR